MPETYTVSEAAAYLKLHPETVREMIRQGKITASKIGRRFVIRHSTLDGLLSDSENKGVQASPLNRSTLCPNKTVKNQTDGGRDSTSGTVLGILTSGRQAAAELDALLASKTSKKPKSYSTN